MLKNKMLAAFSLIAAMMIGTTVYGADKVTMSVGSTKASVGSDYTVYVSVADVPSNGISCMDLAVEYDSSKISVDNITSLVSTAVGSSDEMFDVYKQDGCVNVYWMTSGSKFLTESGNVFAVSGKVLSGASGGSSAKISIVPVSRPLIPDSAETNDAITVGYVTDNGTVAYDVETTAGYVGITSSGDVNSDGFVDEEDAAVVLRHISTRKDITAPYDAKAADCAAVFGELDLKDVLWILKNRIYGGTALDISKSNINPTTYSNGVLNASDIEMFSIPLGRTLYEGESVKVYLRAKDNGGSGFRSWLTDDNAVTCSNQEGVFEPQKDGGKYTYTLTVKKGNPANAIMIKGPVYGTNIADIDITYLGVDYDVENESGSQN